MTIWSIAWVTDEEEETIVISMERVGKAWQALAAASIVLLGVLLTGCSSDSHDTVTSAGDDYYFNGMVYDGATGGRITNYSIGLQYFDRNYAGKVDQDGRYFLGPLRPNYDFTVGIKADGYRSFLSSNSFMTGGGVSLFYDAYLFPTNIPAPDVTFSITLQGSTDQPSGFVRLRPTAASLLYSDPADHPAAVKGQIWDNDEDLQFRSVTLPFTKGQVSFSGSTLVYGVNYEVTVFDVPGYQILTAAYQSGLDSNVPLVMTKAQQIALSLVSRSDAQGPSADGSLTLVFNRPVAIYPAGSEAAAGLAIDAALGIAPIDGNQDGVQNTLQADDTKRGTKVTVANTQVKIVWDKTKALSNEDPNDPVKSVTYGGLDMVQILPIGANAVSAVSLADLLGQPSITVDLGP